MPDDDTTLEEGTVTKRGLGMLGIVLIVLALVLGIGGGFAARMMLEDESATGDSDAGEDGSDLGIGGEGGDAGLPQPDTEVVSVGSFTVNLRDSVGGRLLQLEIAVEGSPEAILKVQDQDAPVRDKVLMVASDYTYMDLEGMDGRMRMRDEIHRRINSVLAPERIQRVYFTKFVVQ